ncbi:PTS system ascorbate-specific IIC component [Clostridium tetanomorphum]|uniref:Ascorbate-specific PTS system EIIC component n=1 Tax=Clostridium tetanomorphum TaxID=1553 RepID=A0A923EEV6_CLOTT|nr:PTS transporter subunit IIC [Clostridium tetanomorphum]KAJ52170.1 PTS system ascorbate-specific transporter subunit IIC [Clostridium tetanomorphum DSM 665]MBC2399920.1 PTS ascorbate transporter subunit IIC [Clostridium tetanomorphum]MBP1866433.1 PTS system ascorbate-specific IIC component [Clostridium tetanomorphum]NRS86765.1 PTS system ascorbate-specific IIC component [Clostridium tetanomorphum]NRZ99480.1 PTS system ascorbate-specific IIC component [Clostridium tetanomorphum]
MDILDGLMRTDIILVCIITLGLIIQRKNIKNIFVSIVKGSMGYSIIVLGSNMAINTLSVLSLVIRRALHVFDIIPSNETMFSLTGNYNGKNALFIMIIAMASNIIIAKFSKLKYIFINGYYILYMSGMLALLINDKPTYILIWTAGIYLGFFMSFCPYITAKFIKNITNRDDIGLAHFGSFACFIGGVSALIFKNSKEEEIPKRKVSFMRDSNVLMAVSMFIIYFLAIINVDKGFLYDFTGEKDKIYIAFKYSINFTVAFYLIILGVRMMTDEILYAFKGIAEKLIKDAKPAMDGAVFFTYNPEMVMLGFIVSLLGGIITLMIQMKLKSPVVVPSITTHLFSGGIAGIFGYSAGKKRGAILSALIHGIIITIIPVVFLPILQPHIGLMRTCYADSDFGILAILFNLIKAILSN